MEESESETDACFGSFKPTAREDSFAHVTLEFKPNAIGLRIGIRYEFGIPHSGRMLLIRSNYCGRHTEYDFRNRLGVQFSNSKRLSHSVCEFGRLQFDCASGS